MKTFEPRPVDPVDRPLEMRHIENEIVIIGPGSVAFSMTISAARESCRRLGELLDIIAERPSLQP